MKRLIADHHAIECCSSTLRQHAEWGDCIDALVDLTDLHYKIVRHDGLDESVLFPLLARALPDLAEPLALVQLQHRLARQLRRETEKYLLAGDAEHAARHVAELHTLLVGNHTTEEMVIYGCAERLERALVKEHVPICFD